MIKTDTEKLTVEMEGNLADYMMDFVLIVEGIKEEVLREDLRKDWEDMRKAAERRRKR